MRRCGREFGFILFLISAILGVQLAPPAARAVTPTRIMVLGDSISQGSTGDFTWRYRLYQQLVGSGAVFDMVGPRSDVFDLTTNAQDNDQRYADPAFDRDHDALWGRKVVDVESSISSDVSAALPDVLVILLGVNDLAWWTDAAHTDASMRNLITNARAAKPNITIVLGQVLPTQRALDDAAFAAQVSDLNARYLQIAGSMSTSTSPVFLAHTAAGIVPANDLYDGVHPNARGELKIAAAVQDVLAGRLGLGRPFTTPLPDVATGPLAPPTLSVTNGNGQVRLGWTESPGATGYFVWTRNVTAGETWTRLPIPLSMAYNPWVSAGLANGATYEYKLETTKGHNTGAFSNVVVAKPTGPPPGGTTLSVSNGDGKATLSWSSVPNATGYYVWTRNVTAGQAWTQLPIALGGTSWTSTGLANGGTYEFKLESLNGYLHGGFSNVASARPTGPAPGGTSLYVTNGNGQATLNWSSVPNATGYYVWTRNVTAGQAWTQLPIALGGTSWTSTGLANGGTYEFKLESLNGYLHGGFSNVASAKPSGPSPSAANLSVSNGNRQATLSWSPGANATGYLVWTRNATESGDWVQLPFPVSGTSWVSSGLANGGTYEYKLQSISGYTRGAYSNVVSAKPTGPTPAGATLSVSAGDTRATLSWASVSNATGYVVWMRDVTTGAAWTSLPYPLTASPWTAGLLINGHTYDVKLESINGYQRGAFSNVASVRPLPPVPTQAPSLSLSPTESNAAAKFTSVAYATSYEIQYRDFTKTDTWSSTWAWTSQVGYVPLAVDDYTEVRVRGTNVAGAGPWSSIKAATARLGWLNDDPTRLGNLANSTNSISAGYVLAHGLKCLRGERQFICLGNSPAGNRPMTYGDYQFYPGSEQDLQDKQRCEVEQTHKVQLASGRSVAASQGPHLLWHEGRHSSAMEWIPAVLIATSYGWEQVKARGDSRDNPWEIEANLYWGSYLAAPNVTFCAYQGAKSGLP